MYLFQFAVIAETAVKKKIKKLNVIATTVCQGGGSIVVNNPIPPLGQQFCSIERPFPHQRGKGEESVLIDWCITSTDGSAKKF